MTTTHLEHTLVSMSQRIDSDSGAEVQVLPPGSIPNPRSFPVRQNERCPRVNREYVFAPLVDYILVLLSVRKVRVGGLQVFGAWSLHQRWAFSWGQPAGIVTKHTEAWEDKQRIDDLEERPTVKREPASIVADRRTNFQFGGGRRDEILTQRLVTRN